MRRNLYLAGTLIIAAILVIVAMRAYRPGESESQLTVLCGGSFRYPAEKLIQMFEEQTGMDIEISFGGSEDHLPHVQAHRAGDIYITHSPYMKYTEEAQAASRWVPVGYVRPVLVTKKGNPFNLQEVEDLARPDLKVALPDSNYSTCGEMVEELFRKKGIWDDVQKNVENAFFRSHAQTATAIKVGNRDAGMMWNGVAHTWLDALEIIPTPYEYDEVIEVGIVGLSYSKHPKLVEEFLKFSEQNGEGIFGEFGFIK
ncbi:substrate-binding domain-containing protein [Candidatus Poribacteria bacterium]